MTEERAVEIIKNLPVVRWENACVNHSDLYEALSMALKALERQIPKKPEKVEEHLYCPICDGFIGYVVDCEEGIIRYRTAADAGRLLIGVKMMIDEKKLLQQIADFKRSQNSENYDYLIGYICGVSGIEGIIAGQPKVGEWIPVSERLPVNSGYYLVTIDDDDDGSRILFFDRKFAFFSDEFESLRDVIAWMPLPEPYKGE